MGSCIRRAILLCMLAGTTHATDQPKLSPAEQEVLNVSKARMDASNRRDPARWSKYVAEDCLFSDENGVLHPKADPLNVISKLPPEYDHSENPRDYVVHVYGNTAVLTYRATVHERFTDTDIITEMRMTETYIKPQGSWMLIARQWNRVPVNLRKPVTIDTSNYKDYIGQYVWRPLDDIETLSVKDGRLWSQSGKDADEYLPLGGETFFLRSDLGTMTFSRDAQGHVTGYTYHGTDGQEVHAKKIK
jgi:ketosteroid isomerase-like protein